MRAKMVSEAQRRWLRLEASPLDSTTPWLQLGFAWTTFVTTAGVYQVPATLLGGHCDNATVPCSISDELGLGPALQGWLPASFLLCKGILALPAGLALHRFGARFCIAVGIVMLAASTTLFAFASSFEMLILLYLAFGVSYSLAGLTPLVIFTNGWFGRSKKALSIGLLVTGFSAAGVLWPSLVASVAEAHGWRVAATLLPAAATCLALPVAICLLQDGSSAAKEADEAAARAPAMAAMDDAPTPTVELASSSTTTARADEAAGRQQRRARALSFASSAWPEWASDPVVWHLAAMSFEVLYIVNAVQHLLVLFLCSEEVGFSLSAAGRYTWTEPGTQCLERPAAASPRCSSHAVPCALCRYSSLIFALSLVGKVAFGATEVWLWRLPRQRRAVAMLGCALLPVGSALTLQPAPGGLLNLQAASTHLQLACFSVCFGLGYGCSFTLVQSRAAALYGQIDGFPKLQSSLAVAQYLGSFCGVLVTAQLRQATGSFVRGWAILVLLGLLVCVHCWRVCAPRR